MPSKLGQNFLTNPYYLKAIADKAKLTSDDFVIEIGGGSGNLTEFLLKQAGQVVSVELDKKLAEGLKFRFGENENFTIIQDDILNIDLNDLLKLKQTTGKTKIIGNIPYYITTPIIFKFLEFEESEITPHPNLLPQGEKESERHRKGFVPAFDEMIILIQKEVGQRLISKPGIKNYGLLTVSVQYRADVKLLFTVPRTVFKPAPKVDSVLVSLTPHQQPLVTVYNQEIFWKMVKSIFMFRRKKLKNSLICGGFSPEIINEAETKFDLGIRGEKLNINEMAKLSNLIVGIGLALP